MSGWQGAGDVPLANPSWFLVVVFLLTHCIILKLILIFFLIWPYKSIDFLIDDF